MLFIEVKFNRFSSDFVSRSPQDAQSLQVVASGEESIVERALGGLLRSDVSCLACGYTSTVYEPFLDLPLDIQALPSLPPPLLKPQQQQTQQTQAQQQAQPHFPVSK